MNKYFINGSSSLLFIISAIKSLYCSKLILWKIFNGLLVGVSFLCNATEYKKEYILLDYITIILISISYINNLIINSILLLLLYRCFNLIEYIKNSAIMLAVTKCFIFNFYYNKNNLYIICFSTSFGVITYVIRYNLKNKKYTLLLTYIFHVCITSILYHASISAI
jgi:hypothetical protein